jgi:hypothetical protein
MGAAWAPHGAPAAAREITGLARGATGAVQRCWRHSNAGNAHPRRRSPNATAVLGTAESPERYHRKRRRDDWYDDSDGGGEDDEGGPYSIRDVSGQGQGAAAGGARFPAACLQLAAPPAAPKFGRRPAFGRARSPCKGRLAHAAGRARFRPLPGHRRRLERGVGPPRRLARRLR